MILESALGVFVITFLALFFLIGEMLVKLKGIGIVLGLGFMGFYFTAHLSSLGLFLISGAFIFGILLIILDGKLINDGTIAAVGFIIILISVAFAASSWTLALYSATGVILGTFSSFFLIKVLPRREMWTKVALMDQLTSDRGYNSMNQSYGNLLHKEGVTVTVLRPSGTIKVDNQEISAVSRAKWIEKGSHIKIVTVDGTKIEVEEIDQ
ncbi:NfeD family protein [Tenuibacillus multivorans]|uniref:NfeD-like C-terminal, partner-binding n=1 Tax=Tenuibacillus multivorans TaxID=237069 RepID=A0A1G9ZBC3_9BACI|nr:NfeD family protein [Tenuibacillus multivorans]GEL78292.1 hypothetical protein TMU01_25270 [Tenuibacillus multivorans]SDN18594.1 NfeD-like C-terminal, partner-binding [Tenuibacillus multivorans]